MNYVDMIEVRCADQQLEELYTKHRFTPGLYIRECTMPKGMMIVSNIHAKEHPFVMLEGLIKVRTHEGTKLLRAPYFGITKPMTRRILYAEEDTRWMTFHVTDKTSVEEIMDDILVKRVNQSLSKLQLLRIKGVVRKTNLLK